MIDELPRIDSPEEWNPWRRHEARKLAQEMIQRLRDRRATEATIQEVERAFEAVGILGTDA